MEGDLPHGVGNFPVLHEAIPNETGTKVFGHQHAYPYVDPDHILAIPSDFWLECVGESITPVKLIAKSFPHR